VNDSDVALLVTASALFPGTPADESALLTQLTQLSRDDALCICAKLNAIVSGFAPGRSLYERQDEAVSFLQLTLQERVALSDYAKRHGGPDRIAVIFRGQLLELARAIAVHCKNLPGDGETFKDPAVRSAFLRAALIASELWQERLLGAAGLSVHEPLRQVLGKFRKNVEEAPGPSSRIHHKSWLAAVHTLLAGSLAGLREAVRAGDRAEPEAVLCMRVSPDTSYLG